MNRSIFVYSQPLTDMSSISSDAIHISKLQDIPNYSVHILYFYELEMYPDNDIASTLHTLCHKLRPSGSLVLKISNTKKICRDYLLGCINNTTYIQYHTNHKSTHTVNSISDILSTDNSIKLSRIDYSDHELDIFITIQRISL